MVTDEAGRATITVPLPDNLTTWTVRGVGLSAEAIVGEATSDLVATKPLLIRPVAPRFFVVEDRAQLAANVNNNTDEDLEVEVTAACPDVDPGTVIDFQYDPGTGPVMASFDLERSYRNFVLYLYDKLQPDYFAIMIEVNIFKAF